MRDALPFLLDLLEIRIDARSKGLERTASVRPLNDLVDLIESQMGTLTEGDLARFQALVGGAHNDQATNVTSDAPIGTPAEDLSLDGFDLVIDDVAVDAATSTGDLGPATAPGPSLSDFDVGALLGGSFASPASDDARPDLTRASDDDPSVPEEVRRERRSLGRLFERVAERDLERFAEEIGTAWRADRSRETARLLYATNRNYAKFKATSAFASDPGLRRFAVAESILPRNDSLVSFSSVETAVGIVTDIVAAIRDVANHRNTPLEHPSEAFSYVRSLALAVARDPYAGRSSPFDEPGLTLSELRKALSDLERERLPDWQKRIRRDELEPLLKRREAAETQNRSILNADVERFVDLVSSFFDRLIWWVPSDFGGTAAIPGSTKVVFGLDPEGAVASVSDAADEITVRLAGPLRFRLLGRDVAVSDAAFDRTVYVGQASILLDADRVTRVDDTIVESFVEGDYVHLRMHDVQGNWVRHAASATVALRALVDRERAEALNVLAVLAGTRLGDPGALALRAAAKAAAIVDGRRDRVDQLRSWIEGAGQRLGVRDPSRWSARWYEPLSIAAIGTEEDADTVFGWWYGDVAGSEEPVRGHLGAEAVSVVLGTKTLAVRKTGDDGSGPLVVQRPGGAVGAFRSALLADYDGGIVAAAYGNETLLVGFVPGASVTVKDR